VEDEITGETFPPSMSGIAAEGQRVYGANGCVYCHSQQVRPKGYGSDIERGWGSRRTVSRDYINDEVVLLGNMRTSQDLANIGVRQPSAEWHYLHLYDPQSMVPGSLMPPSRFLFKKQKIKEGPSEDAIPVEGIKEGYEVVPTEDAKHLVAYLLSLNESYSLPEAPVE